MKNPVDPSRDIIARWSRGPSGRGFDAGSLALLQEAGVNVVLLPWPGEAGTAEFARACRAVGIMPVADLSAAPDAAESARAAGFAGLAIEARDQASLRAFIDRHRDLSLLVFLTYQQIAWDVAPAHAVLKAGQWPGIRSEPTDRDPDVFLASATREPWIDANAYLVAYLRAMFPRRPALLGYRPDAAAGVSQDRMVPYGTLEAALAEAVAAGGSFLLSLDDAYFAALLEGQPRARAAWRSLGQTVRFLREQAAVFRQPNRARVAFLAESVEQAAELLNLMYRRHVCPVILPVRAVPALDPARWRAVVAADLTPTVDVRQKLLDYARAGGLLMTVPAAGAAPSWWLVSGMRKTRTDLDRDWYALGRGRVIAYREPVSDPGEFALDVIDAVGVRTRDLRLVNAGAVLGLVAGEPGGARAVVTLISYGSTRDREFLVRVDGLFGKATLSQPGAAPTPLKTAHRGALTEVVVDRLERLAVIVLE
ncbi:MAG: hypothetical protein AAB225_17975 [Acidobacteriota bacterium]